MSTPKHAYFEAFEHLFGENGISEKFVDLSDFTIIAQNGERIPTFKLLLVIQSKYFEALFRLEPDQKCSQLEFFMFY